MLACNEDTSEASKPHMQQQECVAMQTSAWTQGDCNVALGQVRSAQTWFLS